MKSVLLALLVDRVELVSTTERDRAKYCNHGYGSREHLIGQVVPAVDAEQDRSQVNGTIVFIYLPPNVLI